MTATERLEFRIPSRDRTRIVRAAELAGEPISAFVRDAASERADDVLREHETSTVVPEHFFDELMVALGETARPNPALADAAARRRTHVARG